MGQTLKRKYRGVCWNNSDKKYRVKIKHKGKHLFLGNFDDPQLAAQHWDCAAKLLQGPNARLNFRRQDQPLSIVMEVRKRLAALDVKLKR